MSEIQYTHPDWAAPKSGLDGGTVSGVGSFPRHWLDHQDAATLSAWGITKSIVPEAPKPLDAVKSDAREIVNRWRRRAEEGGFTFQTKVMQSDERSVERIMGATSAAQLVHQSHLADPVNVDDWSQDWKAYDNTFLTLDYAAQVNLHLTLTQHIKTVFQAGETLKASIDSAVDASGVQLVLDGMDWTFLTS